MDLLDLIPKIIRRKIKDKFLEVLKFEINRMNPFFLSLIPISNEDSYLITEEQEKRGVDSNGLPLPPRIITFKDDTDWYLKSGKEDTDSMLNILKESNFDWSGGRILDFGCATGRLIRHLYHLKERFEIWGTDILGPEISWCQENLSPPFHFIINTIHPHLPFPDNYFHLIYAGSVFTHIDDLAHTWFLELRRILIPKGTLYITIHDEHSIELLDNKHRDSEVTKSLYRIPSYEKFKKLNYRKIVLNRSMNSQIFYKRDYILKKLSPVFSVVAVKEEAYGYQTAILLEKRS